MLKESVFLSYIFRMLNVEIYGKTCRFLARI